VSHVCHKTDSCFIHKYNTAVLLRLLLQLIYSRQCANIFHTAVTCKRFWSYATARVSKNLPSSGFRVM